MKAQQVTAPCQIGDMIKGITCPSQTSLYTVQKGGQDVGTVCADHIALIDQSEEPFKYSFINWKE